MQTAAPNSAPPFDAVTAKRRAALASVVASLGLTIAKLIVGILSGSIGILSEAAHSLLDLGASLITLFALRVSDKPPDHDHPYGHGKIESMAALSETVILFLTGIAIVWEAVHRLRTGVEEVEFSWSAAAVIAIAIVVDIIRSRSLTRVAKATNSPALEADALHFASDILSSSVVLVGLGLVALGYKSADSLAAIGVAGFVCLAAWRLGRRTIDTLIDTAPAGLVDRVRSIAERTPGVVGMGRVRARVTGPTLQVDLEAGVNRRLSLDRMGEVRRTVEDRIRAALPSADVAVSTFPIALNDETVRERILMIAAYHNHPVHHVTVQHLDELLSISLDVEVDGFRPLAEAHHTARLLESAILAEVGGDAEVQIHIEPLMLDEVKSVAAPAPLVAEVAEAIGVAAHDMPGVISTHDVAVRYDTAGLFISFHCTFAADRDVTSVHETVSRIEAVLHDRFRPYRIVSHAEPATASG